MATKIGLGLNPHTLTTENFRFAHQLGVTHIVAHLSNWASVQPRGRPAPMVNPPCGAIRSCATCAPRSTPRGWTCTLLRTSSQPTGPTSCSTAPAAIRRSKD